MTRLKRLVPVMLLLALVLAIIALAGCSEAADEVAVDTGDAGTTEIEAEVDDAEGLVEDKCGGCHDTMRVYNPSYVNEPPNGQDWEETLTKMEEVHGAVLTDYEVATIVDYLVTREPDETEALVREKCTECHDMERIYSADADEAQWPQTITKMKESHGLVLTDEEQALILDFFK